MEPKCRTGLRKESTLFDEAEAGPGIRFFKENRTQCRSENLSFCSTQIIDFVKVKISLNS